MPFKGVDFYRIDDLLTDEERMVRDTVRRFVDDRVLPIIDNIDLDHDSTNDPVDEVSVRARIVHHVKGRNPGIVRRVTEVVARCGKAQRF